MREQSLDQSLGDLHVVGQLVQGRVALRAALADARTILGEELLHQLDWPLATASSSERLISA